MARAGVLVVDDQLAIAENLAEVFDLSGFEAFIATSVDDALAEFDRAQVSALVTDYRMPGRNGDELIAAIRGRGSEIPALVVTGHFDPSVVRACVTAGATAVLEKPVDLQKVISMLRGVTADPGA